MPKMYIDQRGWKYRVMSSFVENAYKARYQKPDKQGGAGWKCCTRPPWRESILEAQADLDKLAAKHSWAPEVKRFEQLPDRAWIE